MADFDVVKVWDDLYDDVRFNNHRKRLRALEARIREDERERNRAEFFRAGAEAQRAMEPTESMLEAGCDADLPMLHWTLRECYSVIYRAMQRAAPLAEPPK